MTEPPTPEQLAPLALPPLNELVAIEREVYDGDRTSVRKGWLDLIDKSPAHLRAYLNGEKVEERSDALDFGQVLHTFVLEAHLIDSRYYREPDGNRSTNAWKALAKEEREKNPGKMGVRGSNWDLGMKLRDAVYAHKAARALLEADGVFEHAMFWKNAETGEHCKALFDKTSVPKAFHADLKTTVDASENAFARSIWNYRYDVQGDHYTEPTGLRFVLIAVEKTPPYAVAVYALGDDFMSTGRDRRMPNLRTYANCRASGRWPSYPQTIQRISKLRWMR